MLADFKKKMNHIDKKNRIVQLYYAFPLEFLPKLEELVPKDCGIITIRTYHSGGIRLGSASIHREAKRRKGAKKLTQKEQLKIARLGTLRIWTLKENLNKYGLSIVFVLILTARCYNYPQCFDMDCCNDLYQ